MVAGHLQQKKGYWYIVLNLHDEQGRRKPKWIATHLPVGNSRRKAEELLFQARQQYADGREASGLLFADYMLQWLEKVRFQVSPTTYHSYKYVVQRGICPYFRERNMTLAGLRPADLDEYYRYLCTQGLSPNTAIHHHANIHKALKDAVRLGLVERNVAELAERPWKTQYLPKYYSADEVDRLVRALQGHWLQLPVALSLFYGLRAVRSWGCSGAALTLSPGHCESSTPESIRRPMEKRRQWAGMYSSANPAVGPCPWQSQLKDCWRRRRRGSPKGCQRRRAMCV